MENNDQIENLHFDISARVIRQLGEELVTDEITAIMELVKNAYDADADWVKISIYTNEDDTRIEIIDNGIGMDYGEITKGWLYISISNKKDFRQQRKITDKKRAPLGEKGLGRLSAQRLGRHLELITGKINTTNWNRISLNWDDFDKETILRSVSVEYKTLNKKLNEKGTKLIIRGLRDIEIWKKDAINSFRGQLSQMIFPIESDRPFKVFLEMNGEAYDLDALNDRIRQASIGQFKFKFDGKFLTINGRIKLSKLKANKMELYMNLIQRDNGQEFYNFLCDSINNKKDFVDYLKFEHGRQGVFVSFSKQYNWEMDFVKSEATKKNRTLNYNIINPETEESVFANPGPFSGEIDEYALNQWEENSDSNIQIGFSEYKQIVQNQIGIRIFRDGFGIKPFGFKKNDWLNLGGAQTSGGSFYGLRPNNVVGYVALSVYENINLVEKTDREGFIDSPYSKSFFELMLRVVKDINDTYEKIRRSYTSYRKKIGEEKGNIKSQKDSANRLKQTAALALDMEKDVKILSTKFSEISNETKYEIDRIENTPLFAKELETILLPLLKKVQNVFQESDRMLSEIKKLIPLAVNLKYDAEYLVPKIEELENQLNDFSELASLGLTAESLTHELYNILDRISAQTESLSAKMKNMSEVNTAFFVYIEEVKTFVKNIRVQVNHIAPSLKYNREQKNIINIESFVQDLKEYFDNRFLSQKIKLEIKIHKNFYINMNIGKLTQIFDNLLLNSEYWLIERSKLDPNFQPVVTIDVDDPFVKIFDNGYGVSPAIESTIFQPFITTKPKNVGRGLGLFITQQILEAQGGEIYLLMHRNADNRRYIFQLNFESLKK